MHPDSVPGKNKGFSTGSLSIRYFREIGDQNPSGLGRVTPSTTGSTSSWIRRAMASSSSGLELRHVSEVKHRGSIRRLILGHDLDHHPVEALAPHVVMPILVAVSELPIELRTFSRSLVRISGVPSLL